MVVLLTGATGFIGRHLAPKLAALGHEVVCAVRHPPQPVNPQIRYVAADFTRDHAVTDWLPRLNGIDVVINAVGIIEETGAQTFEAIHSRAPQALFAASVRAGVKRVIQISALGADAQARSGFHLSKKQADDALAQLPLDSAIVQPSLVYGPGGPSARLFTMFAGLPVIPLPGAGGQMVQPVHIDDVVDAVSALVERTVPRGSRIPVVGPEPLTFRGFLAQLRSAMGLGRAWFLPVPLPLVAVGARMGRLFGASMLDRETLEMLERGNTASAETVTALLGRQPRPVSDFIAPDEARTVRTQAKLDWLLPMLRYSIALVWIITAIVSVGLYPVADSYALLAQVGVPAMLAPLMLYGAAALDLVFGVATLAMKRRRWLWHAQAALILFYTVVISWKLPEFWLHPYGPLSKNLPMLAAIWLLLQLEED